MSDQVSVVTGDWRQRLPDTTSPSRKAVRGPSPRLCGRSPTTLPKKIPRREQGCLIRDLDDTLEERAPEGAVEERALQGAFKERALGGALEAQVQQIAFERLALEHALSWSEPRPAGLRKPRMAAGWFWLRAGHSPDTGGSLPSNIVPWCLGGPQDDGSWPWPGESW